MGRGKQGWNERRKEKEEAGALSPPLIVAESTLIRACLVEDAGLNDLDVACGLWIEIAQLRAFLDI